MGTTCKVEETTPGSPGAARVGGQSGGKGELGGGLHNGGNYVDGLKREEPARARPEGKKLGKANGQIFKKT